MDKYAQALLEAARDMPPTVVMEVCGTHTHAVARYGLRQLLPPGMTLISGPGCPVCVTEDDALQAALYLAREKGATLFSFGDMLRVPLAGGDSLLRARETGADVRVAASPLDALRFAKENPSRQTVWLAVGFETTAPLTAATLLRAQAEGVENLSVLNAHKTMPAALKKLLRGTSTVGALLCPGHVAAITGANAFRFVPEELGLPAAVAGFEPREILIALASIAYMRARGQTELRNDYPSAVTARGNPAAQALLARVFEPSCARWRGLGAIEGSGLALQKTFSVYDARARFALPTFEPTRKSAACRCADILRGEAAPKDCALFGRACTPEKPMGACMVSDEGACAAAYRYAEG